jgi:alanine-glyoxylate transaminase/serine-glyoxylate transaminase/serine-pyruvate transaminase
VTGGGIISAAPAGTRPLLMIPGPSELGEETLDLLSEPVRPHYGREWCDLHAAVIDALARVLGTTEPPYLIPGSGSTGLDAALLNLFEPGQRVVVPRTGYFGDRLAEMATHQGLDVSPVPVAIGQPVDPERVASVAGGAAGVLSVHVETSTGVRHPIAELATVAQAAGAVLVVDAIASVGGETVAVDAMGVDALITAPQKGLEAPAGLAVVALGVRGRERMLSRRNPPSSWYLDLRTWDRHRFDDWEPHPVTMPTNLVVALLGTLSQLLGIGVETRVRARAELAGHLRHRLHELGLSTVASPGAEANLVSVVRTPDADHITRSLVAEHGIMLARGLSPVENDAFRIGLVGPRATRATVDRLLEALDCIRRA